MFLSITRFGLRSSLLLLLLTSSSVPALAQPAQDQPLSRCEVVQRQQRELPIRTLLDQAQQAIWRGHAEGAMVKDRPLGAIAPLQQSLQLISQVEPVGVKAELLRFVVEMSESEPPMGLLVETVRQAQTQGQSENTSENILPLLEQVQQIAQSLPSGHTSTKITALTAVAHHYITLEQPDAATAALAQAQRNIPLLQGDEFQLKALTRIAQEYIRLNQIEAAVPLLDHAATLATNTEFPNSLRQAWALGPIATAYAQVGSFDRAVEIAAQVPEDAAEGYYKGDAIAKVAAQYGPNELHQAETLIQQIDRLDLRGAALVRLARAYWDAGMTIPAVALLDETVDLVPQVPEVLQQWSLQSQLALQYAYVGQPDRALALARAIPDPRIRIDTLTRIALPLAEAEASAVVESLMRDLASIDLNQRGSLIEDTLTLLVNGQRYAQAIRLSTALDEEAFLGTRPDWLVRIARKAAETGDFEAAEQVIAAIPENWADYRNQSWQAIALAHAANGEHELASQAVTQINNSGSLAYQVRTLTQLAQTYQAAGQPDRAQQQLAQALQITRYFDTDLQKTDALVAIAIAYARTNNLTQANALRAEALQAANQETEITSHDYLLRGMVQQYVEAGQYDAALEVALSYRAASNERLSAIGQVIGQMRDAGQLEQALQATASVPAPEVRTRLLVSIAEGYLQQRDNSQAAAALARAFEAAKNIPGPESRTISVREDLVVDDSGDRGSLLTEIALKYAEAGDSAAARQVANALEDASIRRSALQDVGCLEAAPSGE